MNQPRKCSVDGCGKIHQSKGFCDLHYRRFKNHGDPMLARIPFVKPECSVDECKETSECKGMCKRHYAKFLRWGDPLLGMQSSNPRLQWLHDHADYSADECLIWPFHRRGNGYGEVSIKGGKTCASRQMCRIVHGDPSDEELQAAHSCGNGFGGCVNPKHLRWATRSENEQEKLIHGTDNRGEKHGLHKLTKTDIIEIRALFGKNSRPNIAKIYSVSRSCIDAIYHRKNWGWLD